MSASLPVDLLGWEQGREAERRAAPPASALIHQNRNNGIENNLPVLQDEFLAEQDKKAVDDLVNALPSRLRKKMFALRLRIEWMVKVYGINHVGLQTMTIRENVTDRKEFERRFKSIATKEDIRIGTEVVALKPTAQGRTRNTGVTTAGHAGRTGNAVGAGGQLAGCWPGCKR